MNGSHIPTHRSLTPLVYADAPFRHISCFRAFGFSQLLSWLAVTFSLFNIYSYVYHHWWRDFLLPLAVLVSRQFVDMSRIRIEGLLAAFPKLVGTGKQHTYVETENVRYVYQPIEALYLLLVTNKQSNILEDLETLRLLSKLVSFSAGLLLFRSMLLCFLYIIYSLRLILTIVNLSIEILLSSTWSWFFHFVDVPRLFPQIYVFFILKKNGTCHVFLFQLQFPLRPFNFFIMVL